MEISSEIGMDPEILRGMREKIYQMKTMAQALEASSGQFPGIARNAKRALASIKMMELNLCDVMELEES